MQKKLPKVDRDFAFNNSFPNLNPDADMSLELADIMDAGQTQALMDDFYNLTHIPTAIIDVKGEVLVGVGWQEICTKFHRVHPESCKSCIESDTELSGGVAPGEFKMYKCKNCLWDVATPIFIAGKHLGNVFTGQFFLDDEKIDYNLFRSKAKKYGFDEKEYMAALENVPRLKKERINSAMSFLLKLAGMISQMSFSNIKLAKALSERKQAEEELQLQTEKLRTTNAELTRFNRIMVERELRMIDLKKQVNELCKKLGEPPYYNTNSMEKSKK